jgi:phosphoadenosine phosphosulfate reductase
MTALVETLPGQPWTPSEAAFPPPPARDVTKLQALAEQAGRELEPASAEEILRWAADEFGAGVAVTASMADGVLAHLAGRVVPGVTVLFLDTGYHFPETIGTRDAVAATTTSVNVQTVSPPLTVHEHEAEFGRLYEIDPDSCCAMRKVWPLDRALRPYVAWASGIRRVESPTRAKTPVVSWDARRRLVKISPLARWSDEQVEAYITEHGILVNPLREIGYTSIGCAPCTRPVGPGEDPRAGRWAGRAKIECGLHQ